MVEEGRVGRSLEGGCEINRPGGYVEEVWKDATDQAIGGGKKNMVVAEE